MPLALTPLRRCLLRQNSKPCSVLQAAGEKAVREVFPDATIFRPGPLVGQEDKLYNTFAKMAKALPIFPLIGGGAARRQVR